MKCQLTSKKSLVKLPSSILRTSKSLLKVTKEEAENDLKMFSFKKK